MTSPDQEEEENQHHKPLSLPQKAKYRMHAHCNPLSIISIPYPFSPECVDWGLQYPCVFGRPKEINEEMHCNTDKYPINYQNENFSPIATSNLPKNFNTTPHVNIVDIGCGYGGLLFNMSSHLDQNDLAIGMEIRDKVTNYAAERVRTLRINSKFKLWNNIAFIRTNTMKLLLNYFYKGQLDKLFFCFADPHFKRYNHRKRIINKYLLNDYSYVLKVGGKLYSITDVEELHLWHKEVIAQNPCFKELPIEELEKDPFLSFMKDTDEARKVMKKNGKMYYIAYERVEPKIASLKELYQTVNFSQWEEGNNN